MYNIGCVVVLVLLFNFVIGGLATEYVVEYWATYFKGVPIDIPFFVAAIAGLFVAQITVPLAVLTWLLSFVI